MKATFSAREPNILMEAQPGDLFVPLGPDLVECVCAVRSTRFLDGEIYSDASVDLNPDEKLVIVVVACRVTKGEPEYYPTGYTTALVGATPIAFLEQVEPAAFRERGAGQLHLNVSVNTAEINEAFEDALASIHKMQAAARETSAPRNGGYADDFEVRPLRTPARSAATETTGAPISRL